MPQIEIEGVRFFLEDRGTGPVLLLVHGFPLNHTMWAAQIEEFSKTHRVLAPDLRGFGQTDGALYSVSMEQFADDLVRLLDAVGAAGPVHFCGLSMGGYIGWQFAQRHPDRLARLILCDTRAAADSPDAAANRLKMADLVLKEGPEPVARAMMPKLFAHCTTQQCPALVEQVRQMVMSSAPVAIAGAQRGMAVRPDVTERLGAIRVPTLVLCGQHDAISPVDEMKSFAVQIPGAVFVEIPLAGHMAPMEQPRLVNAALRAFLEAP